MAPVDVGFASQEERSTTVASFPTAAFAHLAVANLRTAGIDAEVEGETHAGITAGLDAGIVRVVVRERDAERARDVLGRTPASSAAASSAPTPPPRVSFGAARAVALLFAVGAAVLGLQLWQTRDQLTRAFAEGPYGPPRRVDGCDVYPWKGTQRTAFASCDLDGDGTPETSRQYGAQGQLTHESKDPGGKGHATDVTAFDNNGTRVARSLDEDDDGVFETTLVFNRQGEEAGRAFDDDADGRVERWVRASAD